jgi:hypothetical protein
MGMQLDHLAISCADLGMGVAHVEAALGVTLSPGGQHPRYGTHNRLLGLGEGEYLEVIAPEPGAPVTGPRWFDLDRAGAPRLGNWIVRVPDLAAALDDAPVDAGVAVSLTRADLAWIIAVPPDGRLPMEGGYPTLIEWGPGTHPSVRLSDSGLRLTAFEVHHPDAVALGGWLAPELADTRVTFIVSGVPRLRACFSTPDGLRWLE